MGITGDTIASLREQVVPQLLEKHVVVKSRTSSKYANVTFKIGQIVQIPNNVTGVIVGYDHVCTASESWVQRSNVDTLLRGRNQPFYSVISDDNTVLYVPEESIHIISVTTELSGITTLGRYFQKIDDKTGSYIPTPELNSLYPNL